MPVRLFRIRYKLFLAIAGINACLVTGTFVFNTVSFEKHFANYLGQQELARQVPLMGALAGEYRENGVWEYYRHDPKRFHDLIDQYNTGPGDAPPQRRHRNGLDDAPGPGHPFFPGGRPPGIPGSHDGPPENLRPQRPATEHLVLLDRDLSIVVGPQRLPADAVMAPINVNGQVAGYLAYLPQRELVRSGEQVFAQQQKLIFIRVAVGMGLGSFLMAFGIAWWLSRPLKELTRGTHALTAGQLDTRLDIPGRDELSLLASDFNRLAEALQANQASRKRWIADIAHELRTPLAVLRGEIEALQDGIRQPTPQNLLSLAQEVQRLSRLVEDLHTLSQSDQGALSYHQETVDLGELITEVVDQHQRRLDAGGISVDLQLSPGLTVWGDSARLAQLLANLMQNTLRYTDAPGTLRISLSRVYNRVHLEWEDSSPGVSEQDLPHLTERLFRVESSRNRATGGSGLGLSIAKAIADAHDAAMRPRASALGGLCWELVFPLHTPEASHA
ncbi:MAG: histidine kinase dimerization/phospho-acceptor domain-containing protein [Fluviicoccus sp.]|uniref:ATP-binding protein n=1 Tax=Fluviicoccus sp. TaxID=2003552 RepID=UPI00271E4B2E|nr:ATP-binding protein [Fluviicoccus sp.]MDO8331354.1 histidine kinase dimerization/phospho-acceptor domain-containing protein [Fluviicoccus sp.]